MNPEQKPSVEQAITDSKFMRFDRARQVTPVALGVAALACVGVLFVWDALPRMFPSRAHEFLSAFPLALIALAYLAYQAAQRPPLKEFGRAILLAAAFLLWAANQLWPDIPYSALFNDIAVGFFVFDVFLGIIGWPQAYSEESFAEAYVEPLGVPDLQEQAGNSISTVIVPQPNLVFQATTPKYRPRLVERSVFGGFRKCQRWFFCPASVGNGMLDGYRSGGERSMENHDKRQFTPEEKVAILRRHLIEKVTVPDLCDEYHLHPTVFYRWLKQFFDNGAAALATGLRA